MPTTATTGVPLGGRMDRTAWDDLVAAHTTLSTLHDQTVTMMTQLLGQLTSLAAQHPSDLEQVRAQRTDAAALLSQIDDALADLEHAITALELYTEEPDGDPT